MAQQTDFIHSDWEVIVQNKPGSYMVEIYLIDKSYKPRLAHIVNGIMDMEELIQGAEPSQPTMSLPMDLWKQLKKTMVDNVERDKSTVESELTATKYHLEDMRKLALKIK